MNEFSSIAKDYDKGRMGEDVVFWAGETQKLAFLKNDSFILDLGCGTGIYTNSISKHISAITCGLDPSLAMLRQAKAKSNKIHWVNAVGEHLPLRNSIFNCVFSSQVWHHIVDREGTAKECARVLMADGTIIIRTISHDQLRKKVIFKFFPEILDNQLKVYPSEEEFNRYLGNAGFVFIEHRKYELERYQPALELIEIAEKKLWSMFRPISKKGLKSGVDRLKKYEFENQGKPVRNDETITLVVARK